MLKNTLYANGYTSLEHSNSDKSDDNRMELIGEGSITIKPDIATIEIGVQTSDEDLMVAKNENAEKTIKVIEGLIEMGVDQEDIQTINYSVSMEYDYVEGKRIERGYKVNNILKVTIRDIDQIGEIIDRALDDGANVIRRVTFNVENPSEYYQQALNLALEDTMDKAQSLGKQMGVKVKKIPIHIVEEQYRHIAPASRYYTNGGAETPIESGEVEIIAKLKAIFTYD